MFDSPVICIYIYTITFNEWHAHVYKNVIFTDLEGVNCYFCIPYTIYQFGDFFNFELLCPPDGTLYGAHCQGLHAIKKIRISSF